MSIPKSTKMTTHLLIPQFMGYVTWNDDGLNVPVPALRDFMA